MTLSRRLTAALVALVLPPLAICIVKGRGINLYLSVSLLAVALGVFFLMAALPGLGIWALAILHAVIISLFSRSGRAD